MRTSSCPGSTHCYPSRTRKDRKTSRKVFLHSSPSNFGQSSPTCRQNNAKQGPSMPSGTQTCEAAPFEGIQVDFIEMPRCQGYRYLLVLVHTYSGWVEASPTRTEKAREVMKALLREFIPRCGLPLRIGSDGGPAFVTKVVQETTRAPGITWNLRAAYRPRGSGKVERMTRTLKLGLCSLVS